MKTGSYGNPRDYSPAADKLFAAPIPAKLAHATGKSGTWAQAFGAQADRAFNTWYLASYVDEIAAAGKAVKPVPMYANAALSGAFGSPDPMNVASGGPQPDMVDVWKVAAPSIDLEAPDIYDSKSVDVAEYLRRYDRPDNALMVPEMGNSVAFARYAWETIGKGAIGYAPFGMDATGYYNYPLGGGPLDDAIVDAFATKYAMFDGAMKPRLGEDRVRASDLGAGQARRRCRPDADDRRLDRLDQLRRMAVRIEGLDLAEGAAPALGGRTHRRLRDRATVRESVPRHRRPCPAELRRRQGRAGARHGAARRTGAL